MLLSHVHMRSFAQTQLHGCTQTLLTLLTLLTILTRENALITLITRTHAIIYRHTRTCVHPHTRKTDPVAHAIICTNTAAWMHTDAVNSLNSVNWGNALIILITRTHAIIYRHTRIRAHPYTLLSRTSHALTPYTRTLAHA